MSSACSASHSNVWPWALVQHAHEVELVGPVLRPWLELAGLGLGYLDRLREGVLVAVLGMRASERLLPQTFDRCRHLGCVRFGAPQALDREVVLAAAAQEIALVDGGQPKDVAVAQLLPELLHVEEVTVGGSVVKLVEGDLAEHLVAAGEQLKCRVAQ